MGNGIFSVNGADPLVEWRSRLNWFDSDPLAGSVAADLRRLLSGEQVDSEEGVLELSSRPLPRSEAHVVTVRRPEAPLAADVVVRPLSAGDAVPVTDQRDPRPSPERWRLELSPEITRWELFNCVVHSLVSRANA
jgi:hypothetical protein